MPEIVCNIDTDGNGRLRVANSYNGTLGVSASESENKSEICQGVHTCECVCACRRGELYFVGSADRDLVKWLEIVSPSLSMNTSWIPGIGKAGISLHSWRLRRSTLRGEMVRTRRNRAQTLCLRRKRSSRAPAQEETDGRLSMTLEREKLDRFATGHRRVFDVPLRYWTAEDFVNLRVEGSTRGVEQMFSGIYGI